MHICIISDMKKTSFCLFVCIIVSVQAREIVKIKENDEVGLRIHISKNLPKVNEYIKSNLVENPNNVNANTDTNTTSDIRIELPVYNITEYRNSTKEKIILQNNNNATEYNDVINTNFINQFQAKNIENESVQESLQSKLDKKIESNLLDTGPLILTPFIVRGKANVARRESKVQPELFKGLASHSGFLTVDAKYDSNLFFWYFPVPNKPANDTPLILWLQGGPGASSMTGLFAEIGPFKINEALEFVYNNETWGKKCSLLFIDNPVGTGFSYTNDSRGYAHYTKTSSVQLYNALQQLLEVFPELRTAPLYIAGESYAGKFVPGLADEIHRRQNTSRSINLQGMLIGNGFWEATVLANYSRIAYHFGIADTDGKRKLEQLAEQFLSEVNAGHSIKARDNWLEMLKELYTLTNADALYNILHMEYDGIFDRYSFFVNSPDVRRAIHVGGVRPSFINMTVHNQMREDFLTNYRPVLERLLEHYRVLLYSGHLDMMIPYVLTAENIRTFSWSQKSKFLEAPRRPWTMDGKLAGYWKCGGNLTEAVAWNAGHTVPIDQPAAALAMMEAFVFKRPLNFPIAGDGAENDRNAIL